jgi:hypothetical protein
MLIAVLAALVSDADMSAVGGEADIPHLASNQCDWLLKLGL